MNLLARLGLLLLSLLPLGYLLYGLLRLFHVAPLLSMDRIIFEAGILALAAAMVAACWFAVYRLAQQAKTPAYSTPSHFQRLEGHQSWDRILLLGVITLPLLAVGAYAGIHDRHAMVALASIASFVAVVAGLSILATEIMKPGPTLAIDVRGFYHARYGLIPWSAILGMRHIETEVNSQKISTLALGVEKPHRFVANAHWLIRLFKHRLLKTQPSYGVLRLSITGLGHTPQLIEDTAKYFRSKVNPPAAEHWHELLTGADLDDRRKQAEIMQEFDQLATQADSTNPPNEQDSHAFDQRMSELQVLVTRQLESQKQHRKKMQSQGRSIVVMMLVGIALMLLNFYFRLH